MPVIGTLTVNLEANTAKFSGDLGKSVKDLEEFGRSANAAGKEVDYSMTEARGSLMLVSEELGVHIPRHLQALIAEVPGVGQAFAAMLPLVGVVAAISVIEKLISKSAEAKEKLAEGWAKSTEAVTSHNDSLQVSIEKYKQVVASLEGRPVNGVALSLAEARVEADRLSKSIQADASELTKLMAETSRGSLLTALFGESGSSQARDVAMGLADAIDKVPHDSNFSKNMQTVIQDAWQRAQSEINKNNSADAGAFKNVTSSNEALQKLQEKLSQYSEQMRLVGEDDGFAKQAKGMLESADALREANKAYSDWLATNKKQLDNLHAQEQAAVDMKNAREADVAQIMAMDAAVAKSIAERTGKEISAMAATHEETMRQIEDQEKLTAAKDKGQREAVVSDSSAGVISKMAEQKQLKAILLVEQADLKAAHDKEVAETQEYLTKMRTLASTMAQGDARDKVLKDVASAQDKLNVSTARYTAELAQNTAAIRATETETTKLQYTWATFSSHMLHDLPTIGESIRHNLQDSVNTMVNGFSQGMAKMTMEGKGFGQTMASVAKQIGSTMVEMLVQWGLQDLLSKTLMKTSAASLAGANATASMAGAPWPVDMGAPAFGATMMGAAMAFDKGGTVPGSGGADSVHAMLSPGETVVSRALTNQVKNNRGGGEGHTINVTHHIHTVDSTGFERVLERNASAIQRHVRDELRKNHGRY